MSDTNRNPLDDPTGDAGPAPSGDRGGQEPAPDAANGEVERESPGDGRAGRSSVEGVDEAASAGRAAVRDRPS